MVLLALLPVWASSIFSYSRKKNSIWENDSLSTLSCNASDVLNVFGPTEQSALPVWTNSAQTLFPNIELFSEYGTS